MEGAECLGYLTPGMFAVQAQNSPTILRRSTTDIDSSAVVM